MKVGLQNDVFLEKASRKFKKKGWDYSENKKLLIEDVDDVNGRVLTLRFLVSGRQRAYSIFALTCSDQP